VSQGQNRSQRDFSRHRLRPDFERAGPRL
jgi:hypothetical protein